MGKIRTKIIGLEEVEKKQKEKAKIRAEEKKRKKTKAPGSKGEERMAEIEVKDEALEKKEKAKKIISKEVKTPAKKVKAKQHGKKYLRAKKNLEKNKEHGVEKAIILLKKIKYAKFDETVELHLNVDESGLKGQVELPHSIGKTITVKVVDDKVLEEIEKGKFNFDVLIAHPSYMPKLVKHAKVLGPKGLMPNPKAGTISTKPEEAVKKFEKGNIRWKTEAKAPLVHLQIGKISFDDKALVENTESFIAAIGKSHIKDAFLKTTMSPSLKLDLEKVK